MCNKYILGTNKHSGLSLSLGYKSLVAPWPAQQVSHGPMALQVSLVAPWPAHQLAGASLLVPSLSPSSPEDELDSDEDSVSPVSLFFLAVSLG